MRFVLRLKERLSDLGKDPFLNAFDLALGFERLRLFFSLVLDHLKAKVDDSLHLATDEAMNGFADADAEL